MKEKTLAIPLRTVDYSDTSQVVSFLSRDHGLVEGIAKGAHRPKNPFQGPFDLAVLYEIVFIARRSAGLSIVTEAVLLDGFRGVRRTLARHVAASHVIEFARGVSVSGEVDREFFDLAREAFAAIEHASEEKLRGYLLEFDVRALCSLGLFAPAESCVVCQRPWSGHDRPVFFSVRSAGLLCARCRATSAGAGGKAVRGDLVRRLNVLTRGPERDVEDAVRSRRPRQGPNAVERELGELVHGLRTNLLERELVLLKSSSRWV